MTTAEKIEQNHQKNLEIIKKFRLIDDTFMTQCFDGNIECIQLVLRIVMEMPDLMVISVHTQVFVGNMLNRAVRLDILATDSAGKKINVEIQRSDEGAGFKRARFNSSLIDARLLQKGEDFDALPEVYVVFITENDVIGQGKPLYRIGRYIYDTEERFDDGSHIIYVNGAYRGETPVGKLMHDFFCPNPEEMYYEVLADRVKFFKESKEGVSVMCKLLEDRLKEEREEGLKEGQEKQMIETAKRMLETKNFTLEMVSQLSGMPLSEVKKVQMGLTL